MNRADPAVETDEVVTITTYSGKETFRAGVVRDEESGCVRVSPVPERVGVEMIDCPVWLSAASVEDGCYSWGDPVLTDFGTQIVRLYRWGELDSELLEDEHFPMGADE